MEDVMRSDIALHMRENAGVVQTQNNSAFNALNVESLLLSQYDNSKYEQTRETTQSFFFFCRPATDVI
jgi:hypothetical protein